MKLSKVLTEEHNEVIGLMKELKKVSNNIKKKKEIEDPEGIIEKFLAAWGTTVQNHFRVEEEALFPVLGQVTSIDTGPFATMLEEHKIIREAAEKLKHCYREKNSSEIGRWSSVVASTLKDHAEKEEHMLLPECERLLSAERKAEVDRIAGLD